MNFDALSHQVGAKLPGRWLPMLSILLLGLTGFTGWRVWQFQAAQVQDNQTEVVVPKIPTVTALGRLEPEGETVELTAPTSADGLIEQLLVKEGDRVEAEQVIAILDSRDRLQAALQKAEEQVRIAQAQLAQVKAGAKTSEYQAQRAEIARIQAERTGNLQAQRATVARLEAEVDNARVEYERYESLYQQGAISASERDSKRLTYTTTQRQLQEAQAQIARIETTSQQQIQAAEARLEQLSEVRPVDVEAAEAEVQSAVATVAEAKANLDQAYVRSPAAGQIIKIHARPGEKITEEGIATLGQTQLMMVVAEVYQDDIGKVQPGQTAEVTTPVIPDPLQGTVERIGLQVEQQAVINEDPTENINAKVIDVYIRLDEASSKAVAGLTNLQVTAKIEI